MCASAHAVCGLGLRYTASGHVLSDGLGGNHNEPLLQLCPSRRPYGAGNALSCFVTRAEAFQGRIQERRSGNLRVHGRSLSWPNRNHGQHD